VFEISQRSLNAGVPPPRIVPRHAHAQLRDLPHDPWPAGSAPMREVPFFHHELPMPPQQRFGAHYRVECAQWPSVLRRARSASVNGAAGGLAFADHPDCSRNNLLRAAFRRSPSSMIDRPSDPACLDSIRPDDTLLLELGGCFIQRVLHRRPCRVHSSLHVLPRRFTSRAYFLQFLVRGVAIGAHCLELLVVFGTRVGTHLIASGSQLTDLSIPFQICASIVVRYSSFLLMVKLLCQVVGNALA